jgi:hypothetical protein
MLMAAMWVGNIASKKETKIHEEFYVGNLKAIFHLGD